MVGEDTVAMECCKWLPWTRFLWTDVNWLLWKRLYSPDSPF